MGYLCDAETTVIAGTSCDLDQHPDARCGQDFVTQEFELLYNSETLFERFVRWFIVLMGVVKNKIALTYWFD